MAGTFHTGKNRKSGEAEVLISYYLKPGRPLLQNAVALTFWMIPDQMYILRNVRTSERIIALLGIAGVNAESASGPTELWPFN